MSYLYDEPVAVEPDWFDAADLHRERVELGEVCGFCWAEVKQIRSTHLGIALWKCPHCHCEGFAP